VAEAKKAVEEGPRATEKRLKQQWESEMDDVITKYNANVLRFRNLRWFGKDHAQDLVEAWEQVVIDEKDDPNKEGEFGEAKLEQELLEDFEIGTLYKWRSSHPKSTVEAGEISISSPVLNIETSSSRPATATVDVPAYDPKKPKITIIASKGGMSLVSPVFEKIHMSPTAVANLFFILSHVTG